MSSKEASTCLRTGTSDSPPLLQPGVYRLGYIEHQTVLAFGRQPKVEMRFSVLDPNAMGEEVRRFYRVSQLISKPKRNGKFKAGWHGELLHEFVNLFNERPERLDRIPMSRFNNHVIVGRIRTVKQTSRQRDLHELLQYSVVEELLRVEQ